MLQVFISVQRSQIEAKKTKWEARKFEIYRNVSRLSTTALATRWEDDPQ